MHIGVIAPPWVAVPPPAYGGTELMIDALCSALRRAGHRVTLFSTGDSTCDVERRWLFDRGDPDRMGHVVRELRHALAAYDAFDELGVDLVHDHTLVGPFTSETRRYPVVTTIHGPFDADLVDLYGRVADRVPIVAISHDQASRAPEGLPIAAVIHHGLELDRYPFSPTPGDHCLFLGRMSADKGVDIAIDAARQAGVPLVIAAKMREREERRFFDDVVLPLVGNGVEYVGEARFAEKVRLLGSACALLNPITWPEPFGLVMIEALACGTPVVGYAIGAAPEIIDHGRTGFLADGADGADGVDGLVAGLESLDRIERDTCRDAVCERFSSDRMAADYIETYRRALDHHGSPDGAAAA